VDEEWKTIQHSKGRLMTKTFRYLKKSFKFGADAFSTTVFITKKINLDPAAWIRGIT
jgi:hypothetical protein